MVGGSKAGEIGSQAIVVSKLTCEPGESALYNSGDATNIYTIASSTDTHASTVVRRL
jgi:hypothetical protein